MADGRREIAAVGLARYGCGRWAGTTAAAGSEVVPPWCVLHMLLLKLWRGFEIEARLFSNEGPTVRQESLTEIGKGIDRCWCKCRLLPEEAVDTFHLAYGQFSHGVTLGRTLDRRNCGKANKTITETIVFEQFRWFDNQPGVACNATIKTVQSLSRWRRESYKEQNN
eukprot:scaffold67181_cov38-Cyclotella_meneghiniana.AAC.2